MSRARKIPRPSLAGSPAPPDSPLPRLPWKKLKAQYVHNRTLIHAAVAAVAGTIRQISEGELRWQIKEALLEREPLDGCWLVLVSLLEQELHRRGLVVSLASHLTLPAPGSPGL